MDALKVEYVKLVIKTGKVIDRLYNENLALKQKINELRLKNEKLNNIIRDGRETDLCRNGDSS